MNGIAEFKKVSREQFFGDLAAVFGESVDCEAAYAAVQLPKRATAGSAGYDLVSPVSVTLYPGQSVKIPTGIRALMENGWVLLIFPRSGLGFKYRLQLDNTVGVIDSDYAFSDNEGHIFVKITNDGHEGRPVVIEAGSRFAQGIFVPFGVTVDDEASAVRNGGFGSTNN